MAMVAIMGIVVADDAPIVTRVDVVIDVGEVVAGDLLGDFINPDFPAQFPIPAFVGNLVGLLDNLHFSHSS